MEHLLFTGVDTVVGANLAARLAEKYRVTGISSTDSVAIQGCETVVVPHDEPLAMLRRTISFFQPDCLVVCDAAGDSPWSCGNRPTAAAINWAGAWAQSGCQSGVPLTLLSSDAVFQGPWMFHAEESTALCPSPEARMLRALEAETSASCPNGLIVRTHSYGWSPAGDGLGWIEGIVAALESDEPGIFDCIPHATPILATDLADVLEGAWNAGLSGVYHISGAERTNPYGFVRAISRVFDLTPPHAAVLEPADSAPSGFGRGETSLQTRAIRRSLGIGLPMLLEGLQRLRDQRNEGFDRRLRGTGRPMASKVA